MKVLLVGLCLVLQLQIFGEGCNGPALSVGNYFGRAPFAGPIGTLYFPKYSSYTITAVGNKTCNNPIKKVVIYLNGVPIANKDTNNCYVLSFVFGAYPGSYRVVTELWWEYWYFIWDFEIADNPTGLKDLEENVKLAVYPNPVNSIVHIDAFEEIKTVEIYNNSGEKVFASDINATQTELPLDQFPTGTYFLRVATISEKIIIKKVIVF